MLVSYMQVKDSDKAPTRIQFIQQTPDSSFMHCCSSVNQFFKNAKTSFVFNFATGRYVDEMKMSFVGYNFFTI